MRKYLNQIHSIKKLASWTRNLFDLARRGDFDDEVAVLYSAQDAGVRDENLHRAFT